MAEEGSFARSNLPSVVRVSQKGVAEIVTVVRMAQWIRRLPTEQEILGSSPSTDFFLSLPEDNNRPQSRLLNGPQGRLLNVYNEESKFRLTTRLFRSSVATTQQASNVLELDEPKESTKRETFWGTETQTPAQWHFKRYSRHCAD